MWSMRFWKRCEIKMDSLTVEQLKTAIMQLDSDEVWKLAEWLDEYKNDLWDQEIEEDVKAGRLDWLKEEALRDLKEGRTREL